MRDAGDLKRSRDSPELAFNEIHSSARISVECAFGMSAVSGCLRNARSRGSCGVPITLRRAGFMQTITVAMKLHNLTIQGVAALQVKDTDVSGNHEEAVDRPQRRDHLGRPRALDPDLPHLTSPDPLREELELANGDEEAAAAAALPAWLPLSDPEALVDDDFRQPGKDVEARNRATARLQEPRETITGFMGA